jgi:hypothetical protein
VTKDYKSKANQAEVVLKQFKGQQDEYMRLIDEHAELQARFNKLTKATPEEPKKSK